VSNIYPLAIRFADLWAIDHHQMVDEIYAPEIHMESMCWLDHAAVESGAELHDLEDRLAAMIPAHRHELVRVTASSRHACLETTVVSPTTGEYGPACVWWWLDGNGQVADEVGFFDWPRRTTDCRTSHGTVLANDGRCRADGVESVVDALRRGSLGELLAPGGSVELVALGPGRVPTSPVAVQEIVADGNVVAALVVGRDGDSIWRDTIVVSLGTDDRIASLRHYRDPQARFAPDAVHPSIRLDPRRR